MKKINWDKAINLESKDRKGRKFERVVCQGEKNVCRDCKHFFNGGKCSKSPGVWNDFTRACVLFEK